MRTQQQGILTRVNLVQFAGDRLQPRQSPDKHKRNQLALPHKLAEARQGNAL